MNKLFILSSLFIMLIVSTSCMQKKTSSKKGSSTYSSPTNNGNNGGGNNGGGNNGGGTSCPYGDGGEPGIADQGQTIEYYRLNNPSIIAHGTNQGPIPIWSSLNNLASGYSQGMFYTNARMNIRVIPRAQGQGTDSFGVACEYYQNTWTKMQIEVRVRSVENSSGFTYTFDSVKQSCASKVHQFSVPQGSNYPLVVELMNVKWDGSCISNINAGGSPTEPMFCPWDNVWPSECYQVELQIATDTTKNLPGPTTY